MEVDQDNSRSVVNEDRLSSLPDELIHQILSCIDTKFAVQTCLLSPRWKLLWTSMPYLNFSSGYFDSLPKFAKFINHVLSRRNHHVEVSSVKLRFRGAASQVFVRKITNYVFTHNVQELTVISWPKSRYDFPQCLFSSPSLKNFTFSTQFHTPCLTPKTPWDFPALTTLHLTRISLCDENTHMPVDLFSKCVNLKNLTIETFDCAVEVFDIISPQLSNLVLIDGRCSNIMNLITPQLENLTLIDCDINCLKGPPGLSTFYFKSEHPWLLSKNCFPSLNQVNIYLCLYRPKVPYTEEDAREIVNMLQGLHSARFLTLNIDIVECISAFPDLLSHHHSPFSNLLCLNIDSSRRKDTYDFEMSIEVKNFLLDSSPSAAFIMDLPEKPSTKALRQKEARARRRAKLIAEVDGLVLELHASMEQGKTLLVATKKLKQKAKATLESLTADLRVWTEKQLSRSEQAKESVESHNAETQMHIDQEKADIEIEVLPGLMEQIWACVGELRDLMKQERAFSSRILMDEVEIKGLLKKLPKGLSADIEEGYSREYDEIMEQCADMLAVNEAIKKEVSDMISTFQDVTRGTLPLASQAIGC